MEFKYNLENKNFNTEKDLLVALSQHDKEVFARSYRKAVIAAANAKVLGKDPKKAFIGTLFIDIGFLGMSPEFINAPRRYNDSEFGEMQKHVEGGLELLKLVGAEEYIIETVAFHHVNFDGKGYGPMLAEGEGIPAYARNARIADSVDAFVSNRCYKPGGPIAEVVEDLRKFEGNYDLNFVESFQLVHDSVIKVCGEQASQETYMETLIKLHLPVGLPKTAEECLEMF